MTVASIDHILIDDNGVARIAGKRTKVIQIVMDRMANGWDAEEIHAQYAYLTLGEIHAAFSYYYDHKDALDAEIQRDLDEADAFADSAGESPAVQRLRQSGHLA